MGIFLWIGSSAYGPDFGSRGSAYGSPPLPFTPISQTAVTGAGTAADPFRITTVLGAGATGVQLSQTITCVTGQQYYRQDTQILNTTAAPVSVSYFHAGDIYLRGSDDGYSYYDPATGGVGGRNATQDAFVVFQPLTPATRYQEDFYSTIWTNIGQGGAQGPGFTNTVRPGTAPADLHDNGAGLQWSAISIGAGLSSTISNFLSFGATPIVAGGPPAAPAPPPIPEASTVLLFGGGLSGLASYAALRLRARRGRSHRTPD
jgi:hypothetical protein